jgi:hypothetical protein
VAWIALALASILALLILVKERGVKGRAVLVGLLALLVGGITV